MHIAKIIAFSFMAFIFTLPQIGWNVHRMSKTEVSQRKFKLTFAPSHIQNVHFTSKCSPEWNAIYRRGRSSAVIYINQVGRETKTTVNTYWAISKRSSLRQRVSAESKGDTATTRSCRSRACITSSAVHVSLIEFAASKAELHRTICVDYYVCLMIHLCLNL